MADNSPNTTMEDFTNSTIDTDDLSLLELQQDVHMGPRPAEPW